MWTKGAVVIVKHGDGEIADSIGNALEENYRSAKDYENLERDYTFMKIHNREYWENKLIDAKKKYEKVAKGPSRIRRFLEWSWIGLYLRFAKKTRFFIENN